MPYPFLILAPGNTVDFLEGFHLVEVLGLRKDIGPDVADCRASQERAKLSLSSRATWKVASVPCAAHGGHPFRPTRAGSGTHATSSSPLTVADTSPLI